MDYIFGMCCPRRKTITGVAGARKKNWIKWKGIGKTPHVLIKSMNCKRQGAGQVLEVAFLGNICSCLTSAALVAPFCQEHTKAKPRLVPVPASIPRTLKQKGSSINKSKSRQSLILLRFIQGLPDTVQVLVMIYPFPFILQ